MDQLFLTTSTNRYQPGPMDPAAPSTQSTTPRRIRLQTSPTATPTIMPGTARLPDRSNRDTRSTRVTSFRTANGSGRSRGSANRAASAGSMGAFLGDSWASITDMATSMFTGNPGNIGRSASAGKSSTRSGNRRPAVPRHWGPEPPAEVNATKGTYQERVNAASAEIVEGSRVALATAKRASALESHERVNGGLDVRGKYKYRTSDEVNRDSNEVVDERMVYLHQVKPTDTLAGIVLKYDCREDNIKKANGMWTSEIQPKKMLFIPVDACAVRGKTVEAPEKQVDEETDIDILLARAKSPEEREELQRRQQQEIDNQYMSRTPSSIADSSLSYQTDEQAKSYQHVRWVNLDNFSELTEIVRIPAKKLGYFAPKCKQSITTATTTVVSTPRGSFDVPKGEVGHSRRTFSMSQHSLAAPSQRHQRGSSMGSLAPPDRDEPPGNWLRKAGGVGSLNVRSPGPANDILNKWAKKHIPSLNINGPSMAIIGTETASLKIKSDLDEQDLAQVTAAGTTSAMGAVEAEFNKGLQNAGISIDKLASRIESWARTAMDKVEGTAGTGKKALGPPEEIEMDDGFSDDDHPPLVLLGAGSASGFTTKGNQDTEGIRVRNCGGDRMED